MVPWGFTAGLLKWLHRNWPSGWMRPMVVRSMWLLWTPTGPLGVSILAYAYSLLINTYNIYIYILCINVYIIYYIYILCVFLVYVCMYIICMYYIYIYMNTHMVLVHDLICMHTSPFLYVSLQVPNTMGSGLRFDPSVPDGWKDKDFPHDNSSIGTRAGWLLLISPWESLFIRSI